MYDVSPVSASLHVCMYACVHACMDGSTNGSINGRMDGMGWDGMDGMYVRDVCTGWMYNI